MIWCTQQYLNVKKWVGKILLFNIPEQSSSNEKFPQKQDTADVESWKAGNYAYCFLCVHSLSYTIITNVTTRPIKTFILNTCFCLFY